jgi:hypothetical protein
VRILVIGARIGGLAAARALLPDAHEVAVFEQSGQLGRTGTAVTLWSNGTGILRALDVPLGDACPAADCWSGSAAGLPAGVISFGRACTGVAQDGAGMWAEFADGTTWRVPGSLARAHARLGAAVTRGLLLGPLASGDRASADRAMDASSTCTRRGSSMCRHDRALAAEPPGRGPIRQWLRPYRSPAAERNSER